VFKKEKPDTMANNAKKSNLPSVGMTVKLKRDMAGLNARRAQHVTEIRKLEINEGDDPEKPHLTQAQVDHEGGYWIKTDLTEGS
jgi:hypothetical protein